MKKLTGDDLLLLGVALVLLALLALPRNPSPLAEDAPPEVFSATRALKHLPVIARKPHPTGSKEIAEVRSYLIETLEELGLEVTLQSDVVHNTKWGRNMSGKVTNVLGLLPGSGDGGVLVFAAHYDTVHLSPGAGDNSAAVASLLETARALKASGRKLTHDVLFLFTDGEESGLYGAQLFVDQYPRLDEVQALFNYDGRGNQGPVLMFETTSKNAALVRTYLKHAKEPEGNSLAYSIYRIMPNATDFTIFKKAPIQGLNFAFLDGGVHYHAHTDSIAHISPRTIQHQGSYMMGLIDAFGDAEVASSEGDLVFFQVFSWTVRYGDFLVLPLTIICLLFTAWVWWQQWRAGIVTIKATLGGVGVCLLVLVVCGFLSHLYWMLQTILFRHWENFNLHSYVPDAQRSVYVGLALLFTFPALGLFRKYVGRMALALGGLLFMGSLQLSMALYLPGGTYLFLWPHLFAVIALWLGGDEREMVLSEKWVACVGLLVTLALFHPGITDLFLAMPVSAGMITSTFGVFFLLMMLPQILRLSKVGLTVASVGGLTLLLLGAGSGLKHGPDHPQNRPEMGGFFYYLDATKNAAYLASYENYPAVSRDHASNRMSQGELSSFWGPDRVWMAETTVEPFPLPELTEETLIDVHDRIVNLEWKPAPGCLRKDFIISSEADLKVWLDGRELTPNSKGDVYFRLVGSLDGPFAIKVVLPKDAEFKVQLTDRHLGLPNGRQIPEGTNNMQVPGDNHYTSRVVRSYIFPPGQEPDAQ